MCTCTVHSTAALSLQSGVRLNACLSADILLSGFRSDAKGKTLGTSYRTGHLLHAAYGQQMMIKEREDR